MGKLIKLELMKNNLKPYLLGLLAILFGSLAIGILFCAIPILEPNNPESKQFGEPSMVITMINTITMSCFAILAAVMNAKFVIEEYTGKRNVLLLTYPQKRSDILLAKFLLIFGFVFTSSFVISLVSCLAAGYISSMVGIIKEPFENINLMLKYSFIFAFVSNFIGIIALRIGFYKESIIVPIVASILLSAPFGNVMLLFGDNSFLVFIAAAVVFSLISIILFIGLLKRVNRMECV